VTTKSCPHCHAPIPANAPGGFCPACLLRDAGDLPPTAGSAPSLEEIAAAFPQLEIISLIGQGGMGCVYKARQPGLDRMVALKILSPDLHHDPSFAERFSREARVLGKLNHPNIVTVFEHGESGGYFYLLMEFVDGVNLRQAMAAGRFTPEQALATVPGICDALQFAHEQGVWHRDIKPENILLDAAGRVKIADFGIARIVGDPQRDFTLTRTGGALGSAVYMAPEQHEKPHDVDHRADIYSLGVVIYEMLTGELPLGRFPLPSRRAAVDERIDEIVLRTLEKERELRQQSAGEVKTDVQNAAQACGGTETAAAGAGSPINRAPRLVVWSLALLIGGTTLAGTGFLIMEKFRNWGGGPGGAFALALGSLAGVLGFLSSLWALYEMKRGRIAPLHRPLLMAFVFWPTIAALPYLGTLFWFQSLKGRAESIASTNLGALGYAVISLAVPLLGAKMLWLLLGREPGKAPYRRADAARVAVAVILAASAMVLARYVPWRETQFESYQSRFIQLHGEIREADDMPLIRDAVDRALGESRSDFRVTIRGSGDPENPLRAKTPAVILESTSVNRGHFYQQTDSIAARLRASLPKRIDVNPGAGGAGGGDADAPPSMRDGYRAVRPLNLFLLILPVAVVVLAVSASGIASFLPAVVPFLIAIALWSSSWPRLPQGFPPRLEPDRILPELPAPEYDFSTTRDAVESLVKAARKKDVEAFKRGISRELLEMTSKEDPTLAEPMRDWERMSYRGQVSQEGDRAEVGLKNTRTNSENKMPLVRENGDWKLASAGGSGIGSQNTPPQETAVANERPEWRLNCPKEVRDKSSWDITLLLRKLGWRDHPNSWPGGVRPKVTVWANDYFNFDKDGTKDWVFHIGSTDTAGRKVSGSLIYDQTEHGWSCVAMLPGTFPGGWSGHAFEGRQGIFTREPLEGEPGAERLRYFRWNGEAYIEDHQEIERGG
jgi:tRNA A-37 threonylcarbamoyl transferase component Bud32